MKKILLCFVMALIFIVLISTDYSDNTLVENTHNVSVNYIRENQKKLDNSPIIGCKAAYIAEPLTGKVIFEKNSHEKMYPASTTKILTALVTMENCDPSDKVVVSKNAIDSVPEGYTNASLKSGEVLDIKTLLYALLIPSANEAANVLAEHVGGSIDSFVELCNKRAKELGCEMLHFTSPNGVHDEEHYCSAYDLFLIAKECQKYDIFNEIVKTTSFSVPLTSIYPKNDRTFNNTNEMLRKGNKHYYEYCTGIKTGHTENAGECFVGSSNYNDLQLISVVMGGKQNNSSGYNDRFYDTKQLFEFTYDNYYMSNIVESGDTVAILEVGKATKESYLLEAIVDNNITTIIPKDIDKNNITSSIYLNDIIAPVKQNQVLGTITYSVDGLEYKTNIFASHNVKRFNYEVFNIIVFTILYFTIYVCYKVFKSSKKKFRIIFACLFFVVAECFLFHAIMQLEVKTPITKIISTNSVIENKWYNL